MEFKNRRIDADHISNEIGEFKKGGDVFFKKAEKIVSNAQNDNNATGWKSFEGFTMFLKAF